MCNRRLAALLILLGSLPAAGAAAQPAHNLQQYVQRRVSPGNAPPANFDQQAFDQALGFDEQDRAASMAREAEAKNKFEAIMVPQNAIQGQRLAESNLAGLVAADRAQRQAPDAKQGRAERARALDERPHVELPLSAYAALRQQIQAIREHQARAKGPAVVLGEARYQGEAIPGALRLQVALGITLGRPEQWKTVPLIGDDVVLVRAAVDGRDVPVSRRNGYHVWVTRHTGEVDVALEVLVPQRGPRGSIEYDFLVARTPVTSFRCRFPVAGLEPRINAAVRSEFQAVDGGTRVEATLRPTARIHLLGLKDLGQADGRQAKVYAESLNLLSIDEGTLELFAVFRYTILYAGAKEFTIRIPADMEVVSADGMGAFRYTEQPAQDGMKLLRGETAFPIRNQYEISLRLRRELDRKGEVFIAPLPRCVGVEREMGWLGIEVPGKLQLAALERDEATAVTVPQLPEEMVRSAVSPILKAYRYHAPEVRVQLEVNRLPEIEPKAASIDRVRAFTKLTVEGDRITDLRITLRNRLRPHLRMRLPAGAAISSALLDGQPFNPSRDEQDRILVPLKRSSGDDRLRPFTISVVLESQGEPMGWLGMPELQLPAFDLPVSSLAWTVFVPPRNLYPRLEGELEEQTFVGRASWHQPPSDGGAEPGAAHAGIGPVISRGQPTASADSGAVPVRFKIPQEGLRLEHQRYWIEAGRPVTVGLTYVRSWLQYPAWMLAALALGLGLLLFSGRFQPLPPALRPWLGLALALVAGWATVRIGGPEAAVIGVLLGLLAIALRRRWFRRAPERVREWGASLVERFRTRTRQPETWRGLTLLRRIAVTIGLCFFGLVLVELVFEFLLLLLYPLP